MKKTKVLVYEFIIEEGWCISGEYTLLAETEKAFKVRDFIFPVWFDKEHFQYELLIKDNKECNHNYVKRHSGEGSCYTTTEIPLWKCEKCGFIKPPLSINEDYLNEKK